MSEDKVPGVNVTPDVENENVKVNKEETPAAGPAEKQETGNEEATEKTAAASSDSESLKAKWESLKEKVGDALENLEDKVDDLSDALKDKVQEMAEDMNLEEKAAALKEKASEVMDKADDAFDAAKEKAADIFQTAKEKAGDAVDLAKEKVSDVADKVKAAVGKDDEVKVSNAPETPSEAEDQANLAEEAQPETAEEAPAEEVDLSALTLAELSAKFDELLNDEDRMRKYKEAEAIKSAFYKKLQKEKAEAGYGSETKEPSSDEDAVDESAPEETLAVNAAALAVTSVPDNPFDAMETAFKSAYSSYKKERAEYNRGQDAMREENFVKKQAVIEDLKALVEKQEDVNSTFPAFRALQDRWREIGPVPATKFRDLNDSYQYYVEKFYDMVKINRDLRDLDFKKNLEAKEKFCEAAEDLAQSEDPVGSFRELQKLHEQWKEYGPVDKAHRISIWERFKAATAVINRNYQAYFEGQKSKQLENLAEKTKLCEEVEAIAEKEVKSSNEWVKLTAEIEEIQKKWKTIGFTTRKDNQKIYERFRAACDKFFEKKRVYYTEFKDTMNENLKKKLSLIEQAEALKTSTDWKKTSEALIDLQKQWKAIGTVPRKKSEAIWKRFRAACDEFFNERDKNAKPENDYYSNLKAKKAIVEEIKAYVSEGDAAADNEAARAFADKWKAIGFVPFKEKEKIQEAYSEAMKAAFPNYSLRQRGGSGSSNGRGSSAPKRNMSEKDRLVQQYNKLQQDIDTYENNIGFFASSKNSAPLIAQMQERIDAAKKELKELEEKIRKAEESETEK